MNNKNREATNLQVFINSVAIGQNFCQCFCAQNIPQMNGRQKLSGFGEVLHISDGDDGVVHPIQDYCVHIHSNRVFGQHFLWRNIETYDTTVDNTVSVYKW